MAATSEEVPLPQKIADLQAVVKAAKTGMLVTRDFDGNLHSRAMTPANVSGDAQLSLVFVADNLSSKCEEIENDSHVNVSFFDPLSTDWASYSGRARVIEDRKLIHEHWSSFMSDYFCNLGDGVLKGGEEDPRVAVIEIIPVSVKYWISKQSGISRAIQVSASAAMGKATACGELQTIDKEEIQLARKGYA